MPGDESGSGHDIVVIGASAGGIEALKELVSALPGDLPAALFVVLHLPVGGISTLPAILDREGELPALHVEPEGAAITPGTIYVAPPDFHIQLANDRVEAMPGPPEHGHRPAIDPLFRSAADAYGPRVVGVILSGALDDGTLGLRAVKAHGGTALVQDPESAQHPSMPESAIELSAPDEVARPSKLAARIVELASDPVPIGPHESPDA
jgi:two-component system, chemotaxis family, protein-glutamate methylesterase/glutaminase